MKYVGVDIGGTNLKAGLVDENGVLLATQKMKVASIADDDGLAWTVASLVQELARLLLLPPMLQELQRVRMQAIDQFVSQMYLHTALQKQLEQQRAKQH